MNVKEDKEIHIKSAVDEAEVGEEDQVEVEGEEVEIMEKTEKAGVDEGDQEVIERVERRVTHRKVRLRKKNWKKV